jgi:uncharacterized membrane protein
MLTWLKSNLIQLVTALVLVTFGYANFTKDTQANAEDIKQLKINKDKMQEDITEIKGDIKTLLERTKKL